MKEQALRIFLCFELTIVCGMFVGLILMLKGV